VSDEGRFTSGYRDRVVRALEALDVGAVERMLRMLEHAWEEDRLVLLAGNGGSAATAEHMDLDLSKTIARLAGAGRGFRTISLTHGPALTAWANDVGVEDVFSGQVRDLGRKDDVLIVLSAMGNSANVLKALEAAREQGLRTIGFLGAGGGAAATLVEVPVVVDSDEYGVIEDVHLVLNHFVTDYFGEWAREAQRRV
jgi:D-sedoheptulose 7-phosphate isomerase